MIAENPNRAITLAGGGPAAGLHIGALQALQKENIRFNVWALSCIGAWVGIVYNQWTNADGKWTHPDGSWTDVKGNWIDADGKWTPADGGKDKAQRTLNFFRNNVFRDDRSYSRFPLNAVFAPDLGANASAILKFLTDPDSLKNLWLPEKFIEAFNQSVSFWSDRGNWQNINDGIFGKIKEGNINYWTLNQVLAVHPLTRFLTSLLYLSPVDGLSRIYYNDSSFLERIRIDNLKRTKDRNDLFIYHNAWDLKRQRMQLFSNIEEDGYKDITTKSLCACSALPYIEETIEIDGTTYCEGALVDTVNFSDLLERHRDLREIWVSRIVDVSQAKAPHNIKDALGNLCMLFAGSLGDDDVKLFKYHARDERWTGSIYELNYFPQKPGNVNDRDSTRNHGDDVRDEEHDKGIAEETNESEVNFDWNWSNFDNGVKRGRDAAAELLNCYFCIKYHMNGKNERALDYAKRIKSEVPLAQIARAITFERAGEREKAERAIDDLRRTDRAWRKYPRSELGKIFYDKDIADRLMVDLKSAGLPDKSDQ
jgi:predicted acylesterase/phospholipase RssA